MAKINSIQALPRLPALEQFETEEPCQDITAMNADAPTFLSSTETVHNCLSAPVNRHLTSFNTHYCRMTNYEVLQ